MRAEHSTVRSTSTIRQDEVPPILANLCMNRYKIDICSLEIILGRDLSRSEALLLSSFHFFYSKLALQYYLPYETEQDQADAINNILFKSICEFTYNHFKWKSAYMGEYFTVSKSILDVVTNMSRSYDRFMSLVTDITMENIMNIKEEVVLLWIKHVFYKDIKIIDVPDRVFTSWRRIVVLNLENSLGFWGNYFVYSGEMIGPDPLG